MPGQYWAPCPQEDTLPSQSVFPRGGSSPSVSLGLSLPVFSLPREGQTHPAGTLERLHGAHVLSSYWLPPSAKGQTDCRDPGCLLPSGTAITSAGRHRHLHCRSGQAMLPVPGRGAAGSRKPRQRLSLD